MERPKRRRKQPLGRDSSREFYYVGSPSTLQKRNGVEMVHTRGPLINMQCKEMDKKNNQQCKRQTFCRVWYLLATSQIQTLSQN